MAKKSAAKKDSVEKLIEILDIEPKTEEEVDTWNKKALMKILRENQVSLVTVEYDGSGDSGSISGVDFEAEGSKDVKNKTVEMYDMISNWEEDKKTYSKTIVKKTLSMEDAFSEMAEKILDDRSIDWYNNDGGYGHVYFDFKEGNVRLEHYTRIMREEYEEHEEKW